METPETHCKILHISDHPFGYSGEPCIAEQPDKLIEKIKIEFPEKEVFLINVNYLSENIARVDNAGILLLKYLRLNHFNQHCVLYSFLSREQLMLQDPHNVIIFSLGVTFIRMPEDLSKQNFDLLVRKEAPEDLSAYFRGEVDLLKIRHRLANKYGLYRVAKIHNQLDGGFYLKSDLTKDNYNYKLLEYLREDKRKSSTSFSNHEGYNNLKVMLKEISSFKARVIYLDDQADIGWFDFLKSIVGINLMKIEFEEKDTEDTLFQKYNKLQDNKPLDLFICDLRLKSEEENIMDFKELVSYKLIKKIRDKNSKQKLMYFSATNDLNKYKSLLGGDRSNPDRYKPQYIFTKEGIDQNYSERQSFYNYYGLIQNIKLLLQTEMAKKKIQSLYLFDLLKAEQINRIATEIEKLKSGINDINNSFFDEFDLIIFDTNAFYQPDKSIQLLRHIHKYPNKTCIHLSVFAEMKNFMIAHQDNAEKEIQCLLATKCCEYFESSNFPLSEEFMSQIEIENASNFRFGKDFADKILVNLAKHKAEKYKTLFVSNDRASGIRKGRNEDDGPVPQLQQWIVSAINTNLKITNVDGFLKKRLVNDMSNPTLIYKKQIPLQIKNSSASTKQELSNKAPALKKGGNLKNSVKIQWKDCAFDENQYTLKFLTEDNPFTVSIGVKNRHRFVNAFSKLKLTDDFFEFDLGNRSINGLSSILSGIKN